MCTLAVNGTFVAFFGHFFGLRQDERIIRLQNPMRFPAEHSAATSLPQPASLMESMEASASRIAFALCGVSW
jgi:hypothetical protein